MAKKSKQKEVIRFQCNDCKRINYTSIKDKKKHPDRLELNKYCPFDRKHTLHKEMKK